MSFVHECDKNDRKDTKRNKFAWHSKILTNRLRFICILTNLLKSMRIFRAQFGESAKPYATERFLSITYFFGSKLANQSTTPEFSIKNPDND